MSLKSKLLIFYLLSFSICQAQKYDGFVVTRTDSIFKGFMHISIGSHGREFKITKDKKIKPRTFYYDELKSYAYKKDTFEIFPNFYPFAGEDYVASGVEGKILISKGSLKLYKATIFDYRKIQPTADPTEFNVLMFKNQDKPNIYVIKDETSILYGIKTKEFYNFYKLPFEITFFDYEEFLKSIEPIIGDDVELMGRVKNKELKLKDINEIVTVYNQNKRH